MIRPPLSFTIITALVCLVLVSQWLVRHSSPGSRLLQPSFHNLGEMPVDQATDVLLVPAPMPFTPNSATFHSTTKRRLLRHLRGDVVRTEVHPANTRVAHCGLVLFFHFSCTVEQPSQTLRHDWVSCFEAFMPVTGSSSLPSKPCQPPSPFAS